VYSTRRAKICHIAVLLSLNIWSSAAMSECAADRFDSWMQCRMNALVERNLKQSASEKQTEQPSASAASTSLLDRTSAPDLVGAAVQLFGAGQNSNSNQSGSTTVTASAYALVTTATAANPFDPAVYDSHRSWRRLSFTLGNEAPSDQNQQTRFKIFGGKVLIVDRRDVSHPHSKALLADASKTLEGTNQLYQTLSLQIKQFLYHTVGPRLDHTKYPLPGDPTNRADFLNTELSDQKLATTLAALTPEDLRSIDGFLSTAIAGFTAEAAQIRTIVSKIRRAPQFSLSYTGKIADQDTGKTKVDQHRFEAIFDYGANDWTNLNLNASYEYRDSKQVGLDKRGTRVAGGAQFELNHDQAIARGIAPYTVDLNGEASFLTATKDILRFQAKLTVPITAGISLPISLTVANRTELIKESDVRGQFGFTFDVSKLAGLLAHPK
jgi:hypothetical protein